MKSAHSRIGTTLATCFAGMVLATPLVIAQNPTPLVTKSQADLLAVLRSDASLKEKTDACRQLAVVGNKEAIDVLLPLLSDEKLSHMARYALETMQDPAVNSALRTALPKLKGRQLCGTIHTLGVRGDPESVRLIGGYLSDADPDVAQTAARALGDIGTQEAQRLLMGALGQADEWNRLAVCEGLFRCAERELKHGSSEQAIKIYDTLRRQASVPHQVKAGAVRGAIVARGQNGLSLLKESLLSQDYITFAAAVCAASELDGQAVTMALASVLPNLKPDQQTVVLQTLGRRADRAALPAVIEMAKSGAPGPRLAAIRALAEIGNPEAAPALLQLMKSPDREVAQAAQESLAAIPGPDIDKAVVQMFDSSDVSERLTAVQLTGRRRMQSAIPSLLKATNDQDGRVRTTALKRLGELGDTAQLEELLGILVRTTDDKDRAAAEDAVVTLVGRTGPNESVAATVVSKLTAANASARSALIKILASIGGPTALKSVREACKDPNPEVKSTAIRALGSWKTLDAAPDLLDLARNAPDATDRAVALSSYLGLANNADLPAEPRLQMCRQASALIERVEHRKLLLAALGSIGLMDALSMIEPNLGDPATREEACAAAVSVCEALLREDSNKADSTKIAPLLRRVSDTTSNAELGRRARALLRRAESI
ncbi:MAG: HEAT repeat domain-containing protein [Verrucomicrobiae bacterium]|nr:HEAT repeat domain-containing protein [Verrucomicrobiae bacterium]